MKASLKQGTWAAAFGAILVLLAACGDRGGEEQPPMPGDKAVARVNGKTIWTSDVRDQAVRDGMIGEGEPLDPSTDVFAQELQAVIDRKLLAAEALRRRLDRNPLAQRRLAAAREEILGYMLVESSVSRAINENAIRGAYNEQLGLARNSDELKFRQIVLTTQADAEQARKLLTGGAPFETVALERSTDMATKFNGGLQDYTVIDLLPPAYQTALKDAKVGDVVGPFQNEDGWVIVRVEDRRLEQPIPLETVRPQIIRFLTYDQVRVVLQRLREGAKVDMLIQSPEGPNRPTEPASAPPPGSLPPAAAAGNGSPPPTTGPSASAPAPATSPPSKAPAAPPVKTPASKGANP